MTVGRSKVTMDPDVVRDGATKFAPAADQLTAAGSALQSAVNSLGQCWGADESGHQFAHDYVPAAQQAMQAFGQLAQALLTVRQNLSGIADAQQGTDTAAAQNISSQGR
jgi:uncharacterized protein YukE